MSDVQAAVTEINTYQLTMQSNKPFPDVVVEYLQLWQDLGFGLHECGKTPLCLDAPAATPVDIIGNKTAMNRNIMVQQPGGATLCCET